MALKAKIDSLEGLPEGVSEFYQPNESGGYELAVDGMVPKSVLDEFRSNNIKLQKDIEKQAKGLANVDVEEYKALKAREQAQKDQELIEAGKVEELLTQRTERLRGDLEAQMRQFQEQATEATTRASQAEQERDSYLINTKLQQAAVASGVRDTAIPDVLNRAQQVWRIDPETKGLMPMQGDQVVYGRKGTGPMGMDEWFGSLEEQAPHLFKSSTGGGATGGVGVSGRKISIYDHQGMSGNLEAIAAGKVQITD